MSDQLKTLAALSFALIAVTVSSNSIINALTSSGGSNSVAFNESILTGQVSTGGIRIHDRSAEQASEGITLHADDHNFWTCNNGGAVGTNVNDLGNILAWIYEFSGSETANTFNGKFWFSPAQLEADPSLGSLEDEDYFDLFREGKRYYSMGAEDMYFKCGEGLKQIVDLAITDVAEVRIPNSDNHNNDLLTFDVEITNVGNNEVSLEDYAMIRRYTLDSSGNETGMMGMPNLQNYIQSGDISLSPDESAVFRFNAAHWNIPKSESFDQAMRIVLELPHMHDGYNDNNDVTGIYTWEPTASVCGDGKVGDGESCDDGDDDDSDGCTSECKATAGYECHGEPSECSLLIPVLPGDEDNTQTCTETDGGDKPYVFGTLTARLRSSGNGQLGSPVTVEDRCVNSDVIEGFCIPDGLGGMNYSTETRNCPFGCDDGRCLEQEDDDGPGPGPGPGSGPGPGPGPGSSSAGMSFSLIGDPVHTQCHGNQCVQVLGPGNDQCNSDSDCGGSASSGPSTGGDAELSLSDPEVNPALPERGGRFTVKHFVANEGPNYNVTGFELAANIPQDTAFVRDESTDDCAAIDANTVVCDRLTGLIELTFEVSPDDCHDVLTYTATISADQDDPISGNNTRTKNIEVDCGSEDPPTISSIINYNPDPNGTSVPTGISDVGQFKFTASNGNVYLDDLIFDVNATNVHILANEIIEGETVSKIHLMNKTNLSGDQKVLCTPYYIPTHPTDDAVPFTSENISGNFYVHCGDMGGKINNVIAEGTEETFVLRVDVINPNTAASVGGVSVLQIALTNFTEQDKVFTNPPTQNGSHIRWKDGAGNTFEWVDYPETVVKSTSYNS